MPVILSPLSLLYIHMYVDVYRLLPSENYFNSIMTVHCSSPENEILARIQRLSGPDLLNASTRTAA